MAIKAVYCDYFGLHKDPFSIAPDPSLLYPSDQHKLALAQLRYGVEREGGFILLTGEVGTGKTTLTRLMLQEMSGSVRVAHIINTKLGSEALLYSICQELKIELPDTARTDISQSVDYLNRDLLAAHGQNKKTLVVIEEAQNLGREVLEMLRLLTNLETNTTKLLHILLVAQPELLDTLAQKNLTQLNQRVVSRHHLMPLHFTDVTHYLRHRLQESGGQFNLFDSRSIKRLYVHSNGVPRILNLLAERALLSAYSKKQKQVTAKSVDQAHSDLFGSPSSSRNNAKFNFVFAMSAACICVIVLAAGAVKSNSISKPSTTLEKLSKASWSNEVVSTDKANLPLTDKHPTPVQQLFELWNRGSHAGVHTDNLCDVAMSHMLRCEYLENAALQDIIRINRPGIVTLRESGGSHQSYVLHSFQNDSFTISNAGVVKLLSNQEFTDTWNGDYQFLWRTPSGYTQALHPGMDNFKVVNWVLLELQRFIPETEYLITGGIYSQAVAEYVKEFQQLQSLHADGILGTQTIIALNSSNSGQPQLLALERH